MAGRWPMVGRWPMAAGLACGGGAPAYGGGALAYAGGGASPHLYRPQGLNAFGDNLATLL